MLVSHKSLCKGEVKRGSQITKTSASSIPDLISPSFPFLSSAQKVHHQSKDVNFESHIAKSLDNKANTNETLKAQMKSLVIRWENQMNWCSRPNLPPWGRREAELDLRVRLVDSSQYCLSYPSNTSLIFFFDYSIAGFAS